MPPKADKKVKAAKKDDDWGDEPAADEWQEGSNEGGKDGDPFGSQPSLDRQVSDPFKASKDGGDDGWGDDGDTKEKKEEKDPKLDADEEDELDEAVDTPTGAPGLERQKSFRVLDVKDIAKRRQAMIAKAKNLLYVTESDAAALLSYFRWKFQSLQSAWFDNPKKTREKAGLVAEEEDVKDSKSEQNKAGGKKRQCETAFCDEVDEDQGLALPCGHFYCNTCWSVMIKSEIEKGPSCINAMCYGMRVGSKNETIKCREAVPYELFEKYCSETEMAKYTRWLLDSYVECSGVIKWCPKPGCKYAVEYTQGGPKEITCRCGHVFCFLCSSTPHKPAPCDLVKKWRKQAGEDADSAEEATKKLLAAQAKQCPNCKIQIIKDKFCNHMHCTKCGHHFCWLCKKPWSGHSDYYNCSTYKDAAAKGEFSEEENKMMESNKVMQKFMWFKQRYDNCARGVLKSRQVTKKIEEAEKKGDLDGPAFWLKEIVTQLEECHRMLQWTFCLAYFLKTSGLKTLFEQKQAELVAKVDKFHEFLESTSVKDLFTQMRKAKADAVNVVGSVTYFAELGTDSLMDIIQHEADAESETWACVSCQTANPDMSDIKAKKKATHCKKCTACRVHGEPECRSTLCRK